MFDLPCKMLRAYKNQRKSNNKNHLEIWNVKHFKLYIGQYLTNVWICKLFILMKGLEINSEYDHHIVNWDS